jgi:hypothetical protein
MNNKFKLLETAKDLRGVLKTIENLLIDYPGVKGNENYVKYCLKKASAVNVLDEKLNELLESTYATDTSKRKGINVAILIKIIEAYFIALDDIDTAGDMFKPKYCKITSAVENLHRLRWLYCGISDETNNETMMVNGDCYKKENRVILNF